MTRNGGSGISVMFTPDGAKRLADLTTANTGKRLVMFLNGQAISAPRINGPITEGEAVIEGSFTKEQAENLAKALVNQ